MKNILNLLVFCVALFTIAGIEALFIPDIARASIININSRTNTTTNPVIEFFNAGTYEITPIGVADGGAYNAWNAWGYVSLPHSGWLNDYSLSSSEFSAFTIKDGVRHATDMLALSNAISTSFTLASDDNVNFFITDNRGYSDNVGGISLSVDPVPIPGAVWLLGSGLIGLVGFRKKFRK